MTAIVQGLGAVHSTILPSVNPCNLAGVAQTGLKVVNGFKAGGNALNAYQASQSASANFQAGNLNAAMNDYLSAMQSANSAMSTFMSLWDSCFAAGTPLLTPDGAKNIEECQAGDWVLLAPHWNPEAAPTARQVEEVFRRRSPILEVTLRDQTIWPTDEHPFFGLGQGWTKAAQLQVGDCLRSHGGQSVEVEQIVETGEEATVYNLRIAEYHTYFVGSDSWGFSVWAHNDCFAVDIVENESMERVNGPLSQEQAIDAARELQDISAGSAAQARTIAEAVSPIGAAVHDGAKVLENGVVIPGHFHPVAADSVSRIPVHIYHD